MNRRVTKGEALFLFDEDTDTDTSVLNPTRRPQPTNLQNLVTIMEPKSVLPHSRVELRRWFDSHKVGDCVWLSGAPSRPGIRSRRRWHH